MSAPNPVPAIAEVIAEVVPISVPTPPTPAPAAVIIPASKISKRDILIAGAVIVIIVGAAWYLTRPKEAPKNA